MHFRQGKQFLKSAECFTLHQFIAEGILEEAQLLGECE